MHSVLDLLRGPVLGVIFMVFALAGVIVVAAVAALFAQFGLLLRLRPWQPQAAKAQPSKDYSGSTGSAPRHSMYEAGEFEVVDGEWHYVTQ